MLNRNQQVTTTATSSEDLQAEPAVVDKSRSSIDSFSIPMTLQVVE
jgi:hypothetical protein